MQANYKNILNLMGEGITDQKNSKLLKHSLRLKSKQLKAEYQKLTRFSVEENTEETAEYPAYSAESIVITPDDQLVIHESSGRIVHLNFKTLTLEPGGRIICNAPVQMNVDTFIKN